MVDVATYLSARKKLSDEVDRMNRCSALITSVSTNKSEVIFAELNRNLHVTRRDISRRNDSIAGLRKEIQELKRQLADKYDLRQYIAEALTQIKAMARQPTNGKQKFTDFGDSGPFSNDLIYNRLAPPKTSYKQHSHEGFKAVSPMSRLTPAGTGGTGGLKLFYD